MKEMGAAGDLVGEGLEKMPTTGSTNERRGKVRGRKRHQG